MTVQENVNLENSEESESSEDFEFSIEINSNIEKNSTENASIENNSTENASITKHVSEESRECSRSNIDQSRNLETTNENNFSYIEFILKKSVPESSFPAFVERFKKAYIVNDSLIYLDDAAVNELFPVEIGMRGIFKANLKKFLEKKIENKFCSTTHCPRNIRSFRGRTCCIVYYSTGNEKFFHLDNDCKYKIF